MLRATVGHMVSEVFPVFKVTVGHIVSEVYPVLKATVVHMVSEVFPVLKANVGHMVYEVFPVLKANVDHMISEVFPLLRSTVVHMDHAAGVFRTISHFVCFLPASSVAMKMVVEKIKLTTTLYYDKSLNMESDFKRHWVPISCNCIMSVYQRHFVNIYFCVYIHVCMCT